MSDNKLSIPVSFNPKNKFCVARVHYTADPDKNTPEWIAKAKEGISERSWNREYEIAYDVFSGKPVFEDFGEHHIQQFDWELGESEFVMRGWDFGYHHPATVWGFINKYDQLCIRREVLGENEYIKDYGLRISHISLNEFPNAKWLDACDDAGKQTKDTPETSVQVLNSIGIYPTYRHSFINEGLEIIRQRLRMRNDGRYGVIFHPDCKILIDAMKGGYRYAEAKDGSPENETPLKDGYYDHVCLSGNTEIKTNNGYKKLKRIRKGDLVLTRDGYKKVLISKMTGKQKKVRTYEFSNGSKLIATPDHPIWVEGKGFTPIENVRSYDKIISCETLTDLERNRFKLFMTDSGLIDIQTLKTNQQPDTISVLKLIKKLERGLGFTSIFGKNSIVPFLKDTAFTTEMVIRKIINSKILLWFREDSILANIGKHGRRIQPTWKRFSRTLSKHLWKQKNGTKVQREENGIDNMGRGLGIIGHFLTRSVLFVQKAIKPIFPTKLNTVQTTARVSLDTVRLVKKSKFHKSDVYNLHVQDKHEYFANNILVSNCDAFREMCINFLEVAPTPGMMSQSGSSNDIMGNNSPGMEEYF